MNTEGLDCWDDYPMDHGCICGNDCEPPWMKPDPWPYVGPTGSRHAYPGTLNGTRLTFKPRPGYSQNREDYR